jgi:hypothetical protein
MQETATSKAMKLRSLKDTLRSCTSSLQAHVSKAKLLTEPPLGMGVKPASDLRSAALIEAAPVPARSDV